MSAFTDAFEDALAATREANGGPEFVTINGKKHEAIIGNVEIDESDLTFGGIAIEGTYKCQCRLSEFPKESDRGGTAVARGDHLEVLSAEESNACMVITIGDRAATQ